jgi:hypothetical protein
MAYRKYARNDEYWSQPTIENSYWAGFIAADGNLGYTKRRGYWLTIKLTETDRDVLDRLKLTLNYEGPLRHYKASDYVYKKDNKSGFPVGYIMHGNQAVALDITSALQYHKDLLLHYNIIPNKTFILQPPNITNMQMIKAYIAGYYDGDGSLSWHRKNNSPQWHILGNVNMLQWIKYILESLTGEHFTLMNKANKYSNISGIYKGGAGVYKTLELFSDLHLPRLERKWDVDLVRNRVIDNYNNKVL